MKQRIVMAFGSFDVVHPGHLYYFKSSKKFGDKLIVVVGRDKTIKKAKGTNPLYEEEDRLECVKALKTVDMAVLGDEEDTFKVLDEFKPDVVCLGYDQNSFITEKLAEEIKKRGLRTKIVRIKPYKEDRFKSSKFKEGDKIKCQKFSTSLY